MRIVMRAPISTLDIRRFIRWMVAFAGPDYSSRFVHHRRVLNPRVFLDLDSDRFERNPQPWLSGRFADLSELTVKCRFPDSEHPGRFERVAIRSLVSRNDCRPFHLGQGSTYFRLRSL